MSVCKRIIINLPEELVDKLESLAHMKQISCNELLCNVARGYVAECRRQKLEAQTKIEEMKKGYEEMGSINITIAEEGLYGGTSEK